jgi:pimeloyl-ACP methyl ester carboxylesterase
MSPAARPPYRRRMTAMANTARETLLAGLPVNERRRHLAGVSTSVLEGGEGPPMVLLHGPGEFAATWIPVLPRLARTHRVIVPDLPGHGASQVEEGLLDAERVLRWLDELIEETCPAPPVLVGGTVGGAIAARFAAQVTTTQFTTTQRGPRIAGLVLVDTLGLAPFEPAPRFGIALHRFLAGPTQRSYERLMEFCTFDLDRVREQLGQRWDPYAAYAVELACDTRVQAALGSLIGQFAAAPIPSEQLARIDVPTTLIWGRHDLATPLHVAEAASVRYGWPLHVVEDAGDEPFLDQPDAFLDALRVAVQMTGGTVAVS